MNIFEKFFGSERLKPNLKPLQFTELAILKISEHLKNYPQSNFHIKVDYREKKYIVQVGFDKKGNTTTQFHYPVLVSISPKDELFLRGFSLDFQVKENAFFVAPEIQVEAYDTPRNNIKKFFINRLIVSSNSEVSEIILEKNSIQNSQLPYFVKQIFSFPFVLSFFAKENRIQVEFEEKLDILKQEKEVGEFLAEYFETCAYPLFYTKGKLGVEYFRDARPEGFEPPTF